MPELPEVETVRDGLARHVLGRSVVGVDVLRDYSVRRQPGGPAELAGVLRGRALERAVRRGKFLWLELDGADADGGEALGAHLGMSGQLLVRPPGAVPAADAVRHLRVRLHLDDLSALDFVDQRTFGHLLTDELVPTPDGAPGGQGSNLPVVPAHVSHIARDLLDPALDREALVGTFRGKRSEVKRVLLDQRVVSGVGNIYADEALWRAGVHYAHSCARLAPDRVHDLLGHAADVMRAALHEGGTSFDALYVNVNGASGYFDRSLDAYGRAGEGCRRCGTAIVREAFMNRSSHLCPRCQRLP